MDGAPVGAESLWPSVIRWKPVLSSNPKNPVLGFHGWDETAPQGSVYLITSFFFFSLEPFSYHAFFFPCSHFFPGPFFFSLFSFS